MIADKEYHGIVMPDQVARDIVMGRLFQSIYHRVKFAVAKMINDPRHHFARGYLSEHFAHHRRARKMFAIQKVIRRCSEIKNDSDVPSSQFKKSTCHIGPTSHPNFMHSSPERHALRRLALPRSKLSSSRDIT